MGNQQGQNLGEDGDQDALLHQYANYRRYQEQLRNSQLKKKKKKPYTIKEDDTNKDYMLFTNNLYEAKVQQKIYKKQKAHYTDFNRKLRYSSSMNQQKRFESNQNHLNLPPTYNYHSKVMENMIPNKTYIYLMQYQRKQIDQIDSPIYNILFSQDGSQLLVTTQVANLYLRYILQSKIMFISTLNKNLLNKNVLKNIQENLYTYNEQDGEFKRGKVLYPRNITWTITDSDLSSSGRFLIHCSLNPFISIFDIHNGKYTNFYNLHDDEEYDEYSYDSLRFFSCKYSGDDTKIIASSGKMSGRKAQIKMFDVNRERIQDSIQAHDDDINSITFVDKHNSSVFVSGSDDRTVKIWDTRALGAHGQCAGELLGHVAGITHVDSRQDNYYVASNGKDSCVKLWDLRMSVQSSVGKHRVNSSFDYRQTNFL